MVFDPASLQLVEYYHDSPGQPFVTVRPGAVATFYLCGDWVAACAAIADAIEIFFSVVPRTELRSYLSARGHFRDISPSVVTRDLKQLRKLPSGYEGYTFQYSSGSPSQVGDYGIWVRVLAPPPDSWGGVNVLGIGVQVSEPNPFPDRTQTLRLELPFDVLARVGEDAFVNLIERIAEVLPIHCGAVGYGFAQVHPHDTRSEAFVHPLLGRYLGFDLSDRIIADSLLGHTYSAHWLTVFGADLMSALGGADRLRETAPQAHLWTGKRCAIVRASRVPAVGDVREGASDLGALPGVARFLQPLRVQDVRCYGDDFDVRHWLARFDGLSNTDWENG
jgi:hypothetical protein